MRMMASLNKKSTVRLFYRILRSYLLILVIPLFISLILAQLSSSILEKEVRKSTLASLEQTRDIIDSRLQELDSLVRQLAIDPKVRSFISTKSREVWKNGTYELWSLTKSLPNLNMTNYFIDQYFIYSNQMGLTVSFEESFLDDQLDFSRVFQYGNWDYQSWNQFFLQTYHKKRFVSQAEFRKGERTTKGFYYLQSIPLEFTQTRPMGLVLFFIDEEKIKAYLRRIDVGTNGVVMVVDSEGKVVGSISETWSLERQESAFKRISANQSLESGNQRFIISKAISENNGWTYISVLPESLVLASVLFVRNIVLLLFFVSLLASCVLAFILAKRSSRPIEDEFDFLNKVISGLSVQRATLQEILSHQTPVVQSDLVRRLISGLVVDREEIAVQAQVANMDLEGSVMIAGVLRVNGYGEASHVNSVDEINLIKAFIRKKIGDLPDVCVYAQDDDFLTLNLLALSKTLSSRKLAKFLDDFLKKLVRVLAEDLHASVSLALGDPVDSADRLVFSHRQALDQLKGSSDRSPQGSSQFQYPLETEMRLVSWLKKGDQTGITEVIAQIRKENLELRSLGASAFAALAAMMYASLVRSLPEAVGNRLVQDTDYSDKDRWFGSFEQQLHLLCREIEENRTSGVSQQLRDIHEYMQQHLADPNLTLGSVARHFSMSETFLYHFYRDKAGVSFADQLEKIRIDQACRLLAGSKLQIKQVIMETGFTADSTFRRAFRRVMGIAPSEYNPS